MPSRDIPLERGAVNLGSERGLLAMNERLALALARRAPGSNGAQLSLRSGPAASVHPSASIVGPVILHEGAEVGEGATIIGPSVVGRRGQVGPGATVAQSVVGSGCVVPRGATIRHRVFLGDAEEDGDRDVPEPALDPTSDAEGWETAAPRASRRDASIALPGRQARARRHRGGARPRCSSPRWAS